MWSGLMSGVAGCQLGRGDLYGGVGAGSEGGVGPLLMMLRAKDVSGLKSEEVVICL